MLLVHRAFCKLYIPIFSSAGAGTSFVVVVVASTVVVVPPVVVTEIEPMNAPSMALSTTKGTSPPPPVVPLSKSASSVSVNRVVVRKNVAGHYQASNKHGHL